MNFTRWGASIALVALALTGCGNLTKSPAEGLNFKPPSDWNASPGIMGMMQIWTTGSGVNGRQLLMLMRLPAVVKTNEAIDKANIQDAKIEEQRDLTICGTTKAHFVRMTATSKTEKTPVEVEMVMAPQSSSTLMAMYERPRAFKPDATAEAAIYQLCPTKS